MTDVWVSAAPVLLEALAEARVFRRNRKVSGCLTRESEERETWTAESLRAASSNGEALSFSGKGRPLEETMAVYV